MAKSYFDWGLLSRGDDYYHEAKVREGDTYDINFSVRGKDTVYAYFDLYDFSDDLDLFLYKDDGSKSRKPYYEISSSESEGDEEESIFKGLTARTTSLKSNTLKILTDDQKRQNSPLILMQFLSKKSLSCRTTHYFLNNNFAEFRAIWWPRQRDIGAGELRAKCQPQCCCRGDRWHSTESPRFNEKHLDQQG